MTPNRLSLGAAWLTGLLLVGCADQPKSPTVSRAEPTPAAATPLAPPPPASVGNYQANQLSGDYAHYPAVSQFIDTMVASHGFSRPYLLGLFSTAKRKQWTLDYLAKSDQHLAGKPAKGSWTRYRSQFLDDRHINAGIQFWHGHAASLQRASQQYGVPAEYILGILAVETTFGSFVGNHRVLDALTTLSFDYARRGEYFRSELEKFLIMTRTEGLDPAQPLGSFAGAMGLGQFMPSSFMQWAVDFNGDGRRDLWNADDAIGSVAHYFAQHGWRSGQPVVSNTRGQAVADADLMIGLKHSHSLASLQQAGLAPDTPCQCDYPLHLLQLRHTQHDQFRIGHPNFITITRYNQSTHYAMAVHELAQAIKEGYQQKLALLPSHP
jgi:membrane-bound lytic murein transglycosylase B